MYWCRTHLSIIKKVQKIKYFHETLGGASKKYTLNLKVQKDVVGEGKYIKKKIICVYIIEVQE